MRNERYLATVGGLVMAAVAVWCYAAGWHVIGLIFGAGAILRLIVLAS